MAKEAVDKLCLAEKEGKELVANSHKNASDIIKKAELDGKALVEERLSKAREDGGELEAKAKAEAEAIYAKASKEARLKCDELKNKMSANEKNVIDGIIAEIIS